MKLRIHKEASVLKLGLFGVTSTLVACLDFGCARHSKNRYDPHCYSHQSRSSVLQVMDSQSANGQDLTNTLWNHYFDEGKPDLNQFGRNHLARYVRQATHAPQPIFLQTAYDVKARQDDVDAFVKERTELDRKRIDNVNEYLSKMYQISPSNIAISDPAPASMHSEELMRGQRLMVRHVEGFLPLETTRSQFQFGGGDSPDFGGGFSGGGFDNFGMGADPMSNATDNASTFGTDGATPGFGSDIPGSDMPTSSPLTLPNENQSSYRPSDSPNLFVTQRIGG